MSETLMLVFAGTGAAVAVIAALALGIGYIRRVGAKPAAGQLSGEEADALRARLEALEQRAAETEERVDFVERALTQSRDAPRLGDPSKR